MNTAPSALLDVISNLLRQHVHGALRMTRRQERECTRIDDSELIHAVHLRFRVNDCPIIIASPHLASGRRMPDCQAILPDPIQDSLVALNIRAGPKFFASHYLAHGTPDLACTLERSDSDLLIAGIGQPVGIDDGQIRSIGGLERYVPAGERR